ncbi:Bombyxin A-2-like [Papilio machaon]|uniref:Bombyxin A-2-like n=1 Tax=Papilio machaon TaxID=76193 RepID=A0A194RFE4_PAPMA|nr:Bombyxin A-2-like [Papilio machaon]
MATHVAFGFLIFTILLASISSQGKYMQMYCGRKLAFTLASICGEAPVKRSGQRQDWPWIDMQKARTLTRNKRQIISECCEKPCTIDELMSYCPTSIMI